MLVRHIDSMTLPSPDKCVSKFSFRHEFRFSDHTGYAKQARCQSDPEAGPQVVWAATSSSVISDVLAFSKGDKRRLRELQAN